MSKKEGKGELREEIEKRKVEVHENDSFKLKKDLKVWKGFFLFKLKKNRRREILNLCSKSIIWNSNT